MKKLFTFNRFFLAFCVVFVLIFVALQIVSYLRLQAMARRDADQILGWSWPNKNIKSLITIKEARILKKDHKDAVVQITAYQSIESLIQSDSSSKAPEPSSENKLVCALKTPSKSELILTYYRTNNVWYLGRVQLR